MTAGSIRLRLLAAAAVAIGVALIVAEIGLTYLFERHIERAVDSDLAVHLRQLIAAIPPDLDTPPPAPPPPFPGGPPVAGVHIQLGERRLDYQPGRRPPAILEQLGSKLFAIAERVRTQ